jgi:signal transduction histidine kinase/CheY-like chemotaxis protein
VKHTRILRAILPPVGVWPALAVATGLLLGAWTILVGAQLAQAGRDAARQATMAAQGVAAGVDATLARFTEQTQAIRATDFVTADRVAPTARLLRLQTFLPQAALFMLSPGGELLAASAPFARQDAKVGGTAWFNRAVAAPPGALVPMPVGGPWLGVADGIVLSRTVTDGLGKPAGLIGALLPRGVLASLIAPDWLAPQVSVALSRGAAGALLADTPAQAAAQGAGEDWGQRLMLSLLGWLGEDTSWTGAAPLHTVAAVVTVSLPTSSALPAHVLAGPTLASGVILLAAWLIFCVQATARGRGPTVVVPTGFGADWQCELDAAGIVLTRSGDVPANLDARAGQPLAAAIGLAGNAAAGFAAALRERTAWHDARVCFDYRTWRITLTPGEAGGFVCSGRDVTAEAEADAARQAAQDAMAESRRNQDRLLISLGHDIRTPMASIMGTCELLLDGDLEDEQRAWLERVHGSCGALLGMLNGLLTVAEDAAVPGALVCEPVDVSALVQEVVNLLRPQARDKGLELLTRCDDLLRGQWMVDPSRLRQVVFNLASNAVKYTTSGRVEIRASTAETDGQPRLRVAVSDTGPGIDPSEREEIFERFRRGRAFDGVAQGGGLGLGLALCRENAAVMGGSITLESALGIGSEFTFECPAERVQARERLLPFAGRTALIVADDGPATRGLAAQLGELGLMVETAPDGYLGLALAERLEAQRGAVDVVVLQGNLPGMPGEAFVIRLRSTAFGRRAALVWIGDGAEQAEVDAIVPAPADPYEVAAVAKQLLAQRPSLDALTPHISLIRGGRILLVDDDQANRTLLAAALSRRGFAVFTTSNGQEALRLASRDSFDVILLDLQMPGIDGFETARRVRALPGRVAALPVIALTALQGGRLRQRCEEAGFNAVLEKPVNLERLTACLDELVNGALATETCTDYTGDVSLAYLEEMVAVVGIERARVCVSEFLGDATARCRRLGELLPGWEVEAIQRCCETISGRAETCGAFALNDLLEEIADAAKRDDRNAADALVIRLDEIVARLPGAMAACLDDIERRWRRGDKAA